MGQAIGDFLPNLLLTIAGCAAIAQTGISMGRGKLIGNAISGFST